MQCPQLALEPFPLDSSLMTDVVLSVVARTILAFGEQQIIAHQGHKSCYCKSNAYVRSFNG